jgi:hypothetical protein
MYCSGIQCGLLRLSLELDSSIVSWVGYSPLTFHSSLSNPRSDYHILMDVPELYHYGRGGHWFTLRSFFVYLVDGIAQVSVLSFTRPMTHTDGLPVRDHLLHYPLRVQWQ